VSGECCLVITRIGIWEVEIYPIGYGMWVDYNRDPEPLIRYLNISYSLSLTNRSDLLPESFEINLDLKTNGGAGLLLKLILNINKLVIHIPFDKLSAKVNTFDYN
jgi:hypothetical protein